MCECAVPQQTIDTFSWWHLEPKKVSPFKQLNSRESWCQYYNYDVKCSVSEYAYNKAIIQKN